MQPKKLLTGVLTVGMLSLSTLGAFAADSEEIRLIKAVPISAEIMPISKEVVPINEEINELEQARFHSFRGVVKEISDHWSIAGAKFVSVEDAEGLPANIIISETTYVEGDQEITEGMELTAFYDGNKPMILIYPPQYSAKVVILEQGDKSVQVDYFDENLVSSDNFLKLNISEETEIIDETGTEFTGDLAEKHLAVIYDVSTRSIPAQTNPLKVIVLDIERENIPDAEVEVEVQMVPLRATAEKFNLSVKWNGPEQSILLNDEITLKIGENKYLSAEAVEIELGAAPTLVDGTTFVPLSFFEVIENK